MVSAGASQKIFRPSLSEMLPRWQTAVEVWPVSTSLMHRARDLTHLRKSCTWGQFWSELPLRATRIVSLGAPASPRAVRTAGWSADQVAIPAVDAATRPEYSMKFRRFSSSLMGFSSGRACLEIGVEKNEPRSHFGSNGAPRGKQERGGQADLVWLPLRLARSGPDHNTAGTFPAGNATSATWPSLAPTRSSSFPRGRTTTPKALCFPAHHWR